MTSGDDCVHEAERERAGFRLVWGARNIFCCSWTRWSGYTRKMRAFTSLVTRLLASFFPSRLWGTDRMCSECAMDLHDDGVGRQRRRRREAAFVVVHANEKKMRIKSRAKRICSLISERTALFSEQRKITMSFPSFFSMILHFSYSSSSTMVVCWVLCNSKASSSWAENLSSTRMPFFTYTFIKL